MSDVGRKIKMMRQNAGLTLRELGERTGVSHASISRYEKGVSEPPWNVVHKIADGLGVHVSQLSAEVSPPPSSGEYVRSPEDAMRWWSEVCMAETDPRVRLVMAILATATFMDRDTGMVVFTEADLIERASLTPETVQYALPKIIGSPYVEKVGSANYAIKLKFPVL
jgi:transcriptional regulator with XRE-family HTH domain